MTVEIISRSISTKVWYRAGIELATPGSAVRHASVARHVTDRATRMWGCEVCQDKARPSKYSAWQGLSLFVWFDSLRPINNLSAILGQVFLGWTSTKLGLMCLAQGHNAVTPVMLEPTALRSRVKHSTTETLRSLQTRILSYTEGPDNSMRRPFHTTKINFHYPI